MNKKMNKTVMFDPITDLFLDSIRSMDKSLRKFPINEMDELEIRFLSQLDEVEIKVTRFEQYVDSIEGPATQELVMKSEAYQTLTDDLVDMFQVSMELGQRIMAMPPSSATELEVEFLTDMYMISLAGILVVDEEEEE